MNSDRALAVFENYKIRRVYDEASETWYFSVVDIVASLIQQPDYQAARNYWKVLKNRLKKEGSQTVTDCNLLKMVAEDGKMRFTDAASPETILTNIIHREWSEVSVKKHKTLKGLKTQNLRDHMSEAELIFTALAELSTRQIAETVQATGMPENAEAGRRRYREEGPPGTGAEDRPERRHRRELPAAVSHRQEDREPDMNRTCTTPPPTCPRHLAERSSRRMESPMSLPVLQRDHRRDQGGFCDGGRPSGSGDQLPARDRNGSWIARELWALSGAGVGANRLHKGTHEIRQTHEMKTILPFSRQFRVFRGQRAGGDLCCGMG